MTVSEAEKLLKSAYTNGNLTEEDKFELTEALTLLIEETHDPEYMMNLGGIYYEDGQFDLALKYYEMAVGYDYNTANECLGYITTDITGIQIKNELTNVVENGITEIEMFRIPADGYFESVSKVGNVTSVLIPDLDINTKLLHEFIFEE